MNHLAIEIQNLSTRIKQKESQLESAICNRKEKIEDEIAVLYKIMLVLLTKEEKYAIQLQLRGKKTSILMLVTQYIIVKM